MSIKKSSQWYIFPIFLLVAFSLYLIVTNNGSLYGNKSNTLSEKDTLKNQPKIDVRVNKKYDENGNLIQYDSSYSIIYSSPGADIKFYSGNSDSIVAHFRDFFENDNFFNNDFFNNNYPKFDFNNRFFNFDPFETIKKMQERIRRFYNLPENDSLFFNNPSKPKLKSQPQNMITL